MEGANGFPMAVTRHPGPQIWIQGDPPEVEDVLPFGIAGIVTNTIILRDMTRKYGQLRDLLARYIAMTDKPVVVEVDGDTVDDFLYAAEAAYSMSPQVVIKVVTKPVGLRAMAVLHRQGVRTMATTVFSLNQAVVVAAAGATWIAPFVGPTQQYGTDAALRLVREIVGAFQGRPNAPAIIGGIVRTPEIAYLTLAAGADGIVIFPDVYWKMLEHHGTHEWNTTFREAWGAIEAEGNLAGFVRTPAPAGR
jgi:transaldolase